MPALASKQGGCRVSGPLDRRLTVHKALAWAVALILIASSSATVAMAAGSGETQIMHQGTTSGDRAVHVYLDDLPIAFPIAPVLLNSTTMVPLRALSEALGFTVTWDESGTVRCDNGAIGVGLAIGNLSVTVDDGSESRRVTLPQPPLLLDGNTLIPLRFFSEAMGFTVDWDPDSRSAWVSSPKSRLPVWGFYALGSTEYSSWDDMFGDKYPYPLEVGPETPASHTVGAILGWYALDDSGRVTNSGHSSGYFRPDGWQAVMMRLKMGGSKAVAMYFGDNKGERLSDLLDSPVRRERLAMSIASSAASFDGAAIDFEGLGFDPEKRERDAANFTEFIDTLKTYLRDRSLTVILPPLNSVYLGYDHKSVGEMADSVIIMAYGYEEPGTPSPTAPWQRVDEAVRLELEQVPAGKLILGIPAYGTLYAVTEEGAKRVSLPAAKDEVVNVAGDSIEKTYDPYLACDYSTWKDGETTYHAYTESMRSLAARVSMAKRYGLGGVAIWRLGLLQKGWLDVILNKVEPLR